MYPSTVPPAYPYTTDPLTWHPARVQTALAWLRLKAAHGHPTAQAEHDALHAIVTAHAQEAAA